ncbi:MAG TPA: L-threonylcarbamoyladenylate synthase [Candidatus Limnocylindrales bacterium]|nr:L-threonylcarbamoyladenylate synthase [Candidatus Limnocylindrales bacterium]
MVETRILSGDDPAAIYAAAAAIRAGEPVAFPTETVYGLGADALDASAVARVFAAKERPAFDPLIVHLADPDEVGRYAVDADADDPRVTALAEAFWPGPLTIVLRKRPAIRGIVTAGLETVGLRVPDHPVAHALLVAAGVPIAAPSANRFGRVSPTRAEHVVAQLGGRIGIVLDGGPCRVGVESTVILLADGAAHLLRPGGTPAEAIETIIGPLETPADSPTTSSLAPGRATSHYAPGPPMVLVSGREGAVAMSGERLGLLAADDDTRRIAESVGGPYAVVEVLSPTGDEIEQAANLFDALHRLADTGLDRIVAQSVPETGLGRAVMDRLRRAAAASA